MAKSVYPKVRLLSHTPDPERLVAIATKICHEPDEHDIYETMQNLSESDIKRLIKLILKLNHLSVIEHVSFTFLIEGVSRAMTHQLVRHRIASYSQQSQRYVDLSNLPYIVPPSMRGDHELLSMYYEFMEQAETLYQKLIDMGVRKEDARFILPNATSTKIITTMNARELRHFFILRLDRHAQWEIREVAKQMLLAVLPVAPTLFEDIAERFEITHHL